MARIDAPLQLTVDEARLKGASEAVIGQIIGAGTDAVRQATLQLEKEFEALTKAVVPGKLWRAWASNVYPRAGQAYNPVGEVFGNGRRRTKGALTYWTQPGVNRTKDGQWLAIPTKAAGSRGRGRDLTPGEWERITGIRLQFVHGQLPDRSFLVAEGVYANNQSGALRHGTDLRKSRDAAAGRRRQKVMVPIFVLIPFQRNANRVALEPAIQRARSSLADRVERNIRARAEKA